MGIINLIRKMHKFVSAALPAFVASTQAGFLTEDYADEGRNLRSDEEICGKGYKKREMKIEELKETFCRATTHLPKKVKLVCKEECDGDKYAGPSVGYRSVIFTEAQRDFCGICCNDDDEE